MNYLLDNDIWVNIRSESSETVKKSYRFAELFGNIDLSQREAIKADPIRLISAIAKNRDNISSAICTGVLRDLYGDKLFDQPKLKELYPHLIYIIFRDNDIEAARPLDGLKEMLKMYPEFQTHFIKGAYFITKERMNTLDLLKWFHDNFDHSWKDQYTGEALVTTAIRTNSMKTLIWLNSIYDLDAMEIPLIPTIFLKTAEQEMIEYLYEHMSYVRKQCGVALDVNFFIRSNRVDTVEFLYRNSFNQRIYYDTVSLLIVFVNGYYDILDILLKANKEFLISQLGTFDLHFCEDASSKDLGTIILFCEKLLEDERMIAWLNSNLYIDGWIPNSADFLVSRFTNFGFLRKRASILRVRGHFCLMKRMENIYNKSLDKEIISYPRGNYLSENDASLYRNIFRTDNPKLFLAISRSAYHYIPRVKMLRFKEFPLKFDSPDTAKSWLPVHNWYKMCLDIDVLDAEQYSM